MPTHDEHGTGNDGDGVIMINVIEIPADQIDEFLAGWKKRAHIMSTLPGFRNYRLHQAVFADSRFQLVNVACWNSLAAVAAAMSNPEFQANRQAVELRGDLDIKPYAALYTVVASDGRPQPGS